MNALGRRPLGQMLPAHPQRQPDELLSSWMVALARANLCKVHTLCSSIAGNRHAYWSTDVDRYMPDHLVQRLSELTGVPVDTVRAGSIGELALQVSGMDHPTGRNAWVLPVDRRGQRQRAFGTQFCSMCLRWDKRPYVRRAWRFGYFTECPRHEILLRDRCPGCGNAWAYYRGEMGDQFRVEAPPINICTICGLDLAYLPAQYCYWSDYRLVVAVRSLQMCHDFGSAFLEDLRFASPHELFRVIRFIIRMLSAHAVEGQLYDTVSEILSPNSIETLYRRGLLFESRCVRDRHRLLHMAVWLLMDWPVRFRAVRLAAGVPRYALLRGKDDLPAWFVEQCRQ